MNVKEFVLDYLQREYSFPEDADILAINYQKEGYVDSMAFIGFIATIEDEFGIAFEDEDMENPDIQIVGKLIEMIESKMQA